jgi:hypothetical protein
MSLFVWEILVTTDTRVYIQPNETMTFRLHLSLHAEVHLYLNDHARLVYVNIPVLAIPYSAQFKQLHHLQYRLV